jgi:drug/metabolite transporter (DMT)-like permease
MWSTLAQHNTILGVNKRLLSLSVVIIATHSIAASCTEAMFRLPGFKFGAGYAMIQFAFFCLCPLIKRLIYGDTAGIRAILRPGHGPDAKAMIACGPMMTLSHGAGMVAYEYINYTTVMFFKSAKVPAVMIGSWALARQKFRANEILFALVMMIGLITFGCGDRIESPRFSSLGLVLVGTNLIMGTATNGQQQRLLQSPEAQGVPEDLMTERFMVLQYAAAFFVMGAFLFVTEGFTPLMQWYSSNGWRPYAITTVDNLLTYVGLEAIFHITQEFDATRANVTCSARKVLTFGISYVLFPKAFNRLHLLGLIVTCFGGYNLHRLAQERTMQKATPQPVGPPSRDLRPVDKPATD